ncbi:hypothetical protein GJAV_G00201300 [Gymnothorax javanicus]|nr:hypothetical protein GJAV_G00201300 [Gymnothorax javanicus]
MNSVPALKVARRFAQTYREYLETQGFWESKYRVQKYSDGTVALPVTLNCSRDLDLHSLQLTVFPGSSISLVYIQAPTLSKKERVMSDNEKLVKTLQELLVSHGVGWREELKEDIPHSWQRHGDLVLVGEGFFSLPVWESLGMELWQAVAHGLGCKRLAQIGRISSNGFRTPVVTMLLGEDSIVTHMDNRIRYEFDVTKCMFSSGNITEKLRIATFDCSGEIIVDLYAGIGYFTLPYLVHARAAHVHACEWNPYALKALKRNLELNGVSEHCTVHEGDNRQLPLCNLADRVNLGLIPSSREGWPVACRLLNRVTGGILHIHQNVTSSPQPSGIASFPHQVNSLGEEQGAGVGSEPPQKSDALRAVWKRWAEDTSAIIANLLCDVSGKTWRMNIKHIEHSADAFSWKLRREKVFDNGVRGVGLQISLRGATDQQTKMLQTMELISLTFLTDSERELILEVLRRDEELRRLEDHRVRRLKAELLEIKRKGAKRGTGSYSKLSCGRCQESLGRLASNASQCRSCNHRVCRNCRAICPNGSWVCSVCAKEADLKKSTGDWFYDQRVNRFSDSPGHDLVRTSLRKRPESKKRETVGELLLQSTSKNLSQPSPVHRPKLKDLANAKPPPDEVSKAPEPQELLQRSDTESVEKTSLVSFRTDTESSHGTPVLPKREGVVEGQSSARLSPVGSSVSSLPVPNRADDARSSSPDAESLFKKNPRRGLKMSEYSRPTSVLDLRYDVTGTSMGDRSKSVPGLNLEEEEEEEDIDSLVEIHKRATGNSKQRMLGSLLSVYSEAGDYISVEVTGDLVFSFNYDERTQTFLVLVKECRDLACGDTVRRRSNPYVKCYLLPDKSRQSKRKTTTKRNTVNPVYNETLKYSITHSQLLTRSLQLSVWHHGRFSRNAFLGEVEVPLDSRCLDIAHEECVTLKAKVVPAMLSSAFAQYKGELVISLKYVSKSESHKVETKGRKKKKEEDGGELLVLIKEAKNLTAMKAGGTSDSFVKGYLLPCKTKATKRKTPVVKKTLNPHYDHTFVYRDVRLEELKSMCLELTVWDREVMSSNDFLGGVRLSSGAGMVEGVENSWDSSGEEVCLWQKMMQYPDSWAEGTLSLRSSMA